jgi:hypothetical protein
LDYIILLVGQHAASFPEFGGEAISRQLPEDYPPETVNTDQNEAYGRAIRALKRAGALEKNVQHEQVKYLNNRLEADHGRAQAADNSNARVQELAYGFGDDQRPASGSASCLNPVRREKCVLSTGSSASQLDRPKREGQVAPQAHQCNRAL